MESLDLYQYIFSFNTEHWINVNIGGVDSKIKYIPLSISEKISLTNKYENANDVGLLTDYCSAMLRKAGYNTDSVESVLSTMGVSQLYSAILEDIKLKKSELDEMYKSNKTVALKPSKSKSSELDPLVNICSIAKELGIGVKELSDLDEISFMCIQYGMGEMGTRVSNSYEEVRNK